MCLSLTDGMGGGHSNRKVGGNKKNHSQGRCSAKHPVSEYLESCEDPASDTLVSKSTAYSTVCMMQMLSILI